MIAIIVAFSKDRVMGNKGRMPWYIKGELRRFRELTTGNSVIMGRKSFEEIGTALPGRRNIVLSSSGDYSSAGCLNARTLEEALRLAEGTDIYIAGGAVVFRQALHLADKLYITEIDAEYEGDTFFPDFDETQYDKTIDEIIDGPVPYKYVTYTRK